MHRDFPGTPPLLRAVNRQRILDHVRRSGEVSRAELAKATLIRPPTVSAVVRQLLAEGLVEEAGPGSPDTGMGRPPRMVTLARNRPRALGFEVSAACIRVGLADLRGVLSHERRVDCAPETPEVTVEHLYEIGDLLLGEAGCTWSDIQGVGVALPGLVDAVRGTVRWSRPLRWSGVPFRSLCQRRWGVDTDVVNNAVAGSLAVHFFGPAQDVENLIYFYLRFHVVEPGFADEAHPIVRVGCGIIINGEPYHGDFGAAGEISAPVAHPLDYARGGNRQPFADIAAYCDGLRAGDLGALRAFERLAGDISTVVRLSVGILDPRVVVLDSDVPELRDLLLPHVDRELNNDYLRREAGTTSVAASTLGEHGMVRGAIVPTLQRVFRMPRWA